MDPLRLWFLQLQGLDVGTSRLAFHLYCRSPDSWLWTDHSQMSLTHSPTPPKCSTRAIMALINNLGIFYHQSCSSSYLDYIRADPGPSYRSRQWKSSLNLIPTRPPIGIGNTSLCITLVPRSYPTSITCCVFVRT